MSDNRVEFEVEDLHLLEDDGDEEDFDMETTVENEQSESVENALQYKDVTLDNLINKMNEVINDKNLKFEVVRFKYLEEYGENVSKSRGVKFGDILFTCKEEDVKYKEFLKKITSISDEVFASSIQNAPYNDTYYDILKETIVSLISDLGTLEKEVPAPAVKPKKKRRGYEVNGAIMKIKGVYKNLYTSGFDLVRPFGLLTSEGALTDGEGEGVTEVVRERVFKTLFDIINGLVGNSIDDVKPVDGLTMSEIREVTVYDNKNYYPMYQLGHLYGNLGVQEYKSWNEVDRAIEPMLEEVLTNYYEKSLADGKDGDLTYLINALTTSLIVTQFDMSKIIKLKCYVGGKKLDINKFKQAYETRKSEIMSGVGKIFRIALNDDVLEVTIMLDEDKYMSTPLFAYEAIEKLNERGIAPSTSKVVLGQDIDGNIVTENLDIGARSIIHISAGTRSGKGVITLNLLGTFLASGNPVVYLDCKPDMASLLQDMGKRYNKRVAAYDVRTNYGYNTGFGIPAELQGRERLHGSIMYTKVLQLMLVLDGLRKLGFSYKGNKRPFFIFDEAIAYQNDFASEWNSISDVANDKKDTSELSQWAKKLGQWYVKLSSDSASAILSELPKGGISSVWLFQKIQDNAWKAGEINFDKKKGNIGFNFVRTGSVFKLMGANLDNSQYGFSKVNEEQDIKQYVNRKARHFAMSESPITLTGQYKIIKPYLVLNSSDMQSDVVHELRGNLGEEMFDKLLQDNGQIHEGIGFEGFANMIGQNALDNLDNGYNLLWEMIKFIGLDSRYNSVEEYIYDCSIDSFYSVEELKNMAKGGGTSAVASFQNITPTLDEPLNEESTDNDNLEGGAEEVPDSLFSQYKRNQQNNGIIDHPSEEEETEQLPWNEPAEATTQVEPQQGVPWGQDDDSINEVDNDYDDNIVAHIPQQSFDIPPNDLWGNDRQISPQEQQARQHVSSVPTQNPNEIPQGRNVYAETVTFDTNPFRKYPANGGLFNTVGLMNEMTDMLLKQIVKMVGSLDRVESLEITGNGMLVNGIPFRPRFEQEVLDSMPHLTRNQVQAGNVVDLFDFSKLKKFRGLVILIIDNTLLAEGRVRKETGLGRNRPWTTLYNRFKYLQEIVIGGTRITNEEEAEYYEENNVKRGYDVKMALADKFGRSRQVFNSSPIQNVWNAKPTKAMTKAVGWTAGIKVASMVALALGPWGLVFGGIAAYSALKGKNRD